MEVTLYICLGEEKDLRDRQHLFRQGTIIVYLKTYHDNAWRNFQVPQLEEDDDLAAKIELLFAEPQVLAKYKKKLINLKWAFSPMNGVDALMSSFEKDEELPTYKLTKTPGSVNAPFITEYIVGYILAKERCFFEALEAQKNSEWKQMTYAKARGLSAVTIGILGVGDIGKYVAHTCKMLGMTVWGLTRRNRSSENCSSDIDFYRTPDKLDELLQNCDYICNILPSTPETRNMLSGNVLENCKDKHTIFINVGRGDIIDDESLIKAIQNKWLGGAILDVFTEEPLVETSPLWSLPEVIITPHISGWSSDGSHVDNVIQYFVDNFHRYIDGKPLLSELDWTQGY